MIYLIRHGQDDERFVGGWSNGHLIEEGRLQIYDAAKWIKDNLKIVKIKSSDITRAMESAEIISGVLGTSFAHDKSLREQNKGLLNGIPVELSKVKYSDYQEGLLKPETVYPEGESLKNLYDRVKEYIDKVTSLEDNTLLVTHRGFINMIYYILNDIPLDMDKKRFGVAPATIHELDVKNKVIRKVR